MDKRTQQVGTGERKNNRNEIASSPQQKPKTASGDGISKLRNYFVKNRRGHGKTNQGTAGEFYSDFLI